MKKNKDQLGDRMKFYESQACVEKLLPLIPFEIVKNSETDIQLSPVRRRNINPTVYIVYWEDEYYIVQYSFSMGTSSYTMNYKCDQVDGVLEFIEDLNSGELVISRGDMI